LSYERERKAALIQRINQHQQNDSVVGDVRQSSFDIEFNIRSNNCEGNNKITTSPDENRPNIIRPNSCDGDNTSDKNRQNFIQKNSCDGSSNVKTLPDKNQHQNSSSKSQSLLEMFQLEQNDEESDPIFQHFKNTKSSQSTVKNKGPSKSSVCQNNNNTQRKRGISPTEQVKTTGHCSKRSFLTKSGSLFKDNELNDLDKDGLWESNFHINQKQIPERQNFPSRNKPIVDSPPNAADFDNDALWQGLFTSSQVNSQAKSNKNSNEGDGEENTFCDHLNTTSQRDAYADTLIIPSNQRVIPTDFTKFPSTSRKCDQGFSLHELQSENVTTESQLIKRVIDAQTPTVENKIKRFKFRKK